MKRIMILMLALVWVGAVFAQVVEQQIDLSKLTRSMELDDFAEKVKKDLQKDSKDIRTRVAEAVLFVHPDYSRRDAERSLRAAHMALTLFLKADDRAKAKLLKGGISEGMLNMIMDMAGQEVCDRFRRSDKIENQERAAKGFLRQYPLAPSGVRLRAQALLDSIDEVRAVAKALATQRAFDLFRKAAEAQDIRRMESLYHASDAVRSSDSCLLAIHSAFASLGYSSTWEYFYSKDHFGGNKFWGKPFYADGSSIRQRDERIRSVETNFFGAVIDLDQASEYIALAAPSLSALHTLQKLVAEDVEKGDFASALKTAESYATYFGADPRYADLVKVLHQRKNPKFKRTVMNFTSCDGVKKGNFSEYDNYVPCLSADGRKLYFCSSKRGESSESIYSVSMGSNGRYDSKAVLETPEELLHVLTQRLKDSETDLGRKMGNRRSRFGSSYLPCDTINLWNNTSPEALSTSGREMVIFINGHLCMIQHTHQGWKYVGRLAIDMEDHWQADLSLASSGNAMLFASTVLTERDVPVDEDVATKSNTNIFVTLRDSAGVWGDPIDLGPTINSQGCDRSPFLHPDMHTLYFASDGHGGLGSLDIYVSHRLADTCWTCWSEPVNLGPDYNTAGLDWCFTISTDGSEVFMAREEKVQSGLKKHRISRIPLGDGLRPGAVVMLSGSVTDTHGVPVGGDIVWEDLETALEAGRASIDPKTGAFFVVLPGGKSYGFYVDGNDVVSISGRLDLSDLKKTESQTKSFKVIPVRDMVEEGTPLPLNNLFFAVGDSTLMRTSHAELRRVARFIKRLGKPVEVGGHTDNSGDPAKNKQISEGRARAVVAYLVRHGVSPDLLTAVGYGDTRPVAANYTPEGRQLNRRVEIRFVGSPKE